MGTPQHNNSNNFDKKLKILRNHHGSSGLSGAMGHGAIPANNMPNQHIALQNQIIGMGSYENGNNGIGNFPNQIHSSALNLNAT